MATTDEIMAGPIDVYVAPKDTAFPLVSAAPAAAWLLVGVQGSKNITEEGVRLITERTTEFWRGLGSTGKQKGFRTQEDARIEFMLADVSAEAINHALGGTAVVTPAEITVTAAAAGIPGSKAISLLKNFAFNEVALLLRKSDSPYDVAFNMQWEIPRALANSNPEFVYVKGEPVAMQFSYELLDHPTLGYGKVVYQTAAPV